MNNKKIAGTIIFTGSFAGIIVTLILAYNFMEAHTKQQYDGFFIIVRNKIRYNQDIWGALSASGLYYIGIAFIVLAVAGLYLIFSSKDK